MIKFLSEANKKNLSGVALLRLDFNTEDDWRMRAVLPTIRFLLRHSSKIVIISHRGRPQPRLIRANGRIVGANKKLSLRKDGLRLQKFLGRKIRFVPALNFAAIKKAVNQSLRGSIVLLENLRFWKGEEANDAKFAKNIASLADYYVNDAFAVSHRANASVAAITKFLPSYAGFGLEKEIKILGQVVRKPRHPLVFVIGGAKASDKLSVIKYFKSKADCFLLGGAAANTILALKGANMKKSLRDKNKKDLRKLRGILGYKNVLLPVDLKWQSGVAFDIGPKTVRIFTNKIRRAKAIIWSGPVGFFEKSGFGAGNLAVARAIAENHKAFTLAGGGETVMFLKKHWLDKKFSFISTGGGAMLEFLAGKKLPGISALNKYG